MKEDFVITTVCNQLPCRSRFIVSSAVPEGLDNLVTQIEKHYEQFHDFDK